MNRPLVWLALAVAAGIAVAEEGCAAWPLVPMGVALGGAALSFSPRHSYHLQPAGLFLVFLAVGACAWTARHSGPVGDALCAASRSHGDVPWTLEGRVREAQLMRPSGVGPGNEQRFVLDVERVRVAGVEAELRGRTQVYWAGVERAVLTDERVRVTGRLSPDLGEVNPGVDGYEDYLRRRGIHTRVNARGAEALERVAAGRAWHAGYRACRLRFSQAERLARALPERALPFVLSVWLGESYSSPEDSYRAYIDSGTAHIFSVSGLHIAIVYASAALLLKPLSGRRRLRASIILLTVWVFALTAGARVGCLRSALMVSVYLASDLVEREPDAPSALGLSALLILLASPDLLFDTGFQLSYLSVASILLYAEPVVERLSRVPHWLRGPVAVSLAAQILPLPAAVSAFHVLPLAATLANLAVVPLVAATLWLAFVTVVTSLLPLDFSAVFGHALGPVVLLIQAVAGGVAATRHAALSLSSPTFAAVACYFACATALWMALALRRRNAYVAAGALLLLTVVSWRPWSAPAEAVFLDVGRGDAAFVRTDGGSTVLIDGGERLDRDGRERVVVPFLHANRVGRLDYVVATHADSDHLAGLADVVAEFRVGEVLLPVRDGSDEAEEAFIARCRDQGVRVRRLGRGDRVPLRGGELTALHPSAEWPSSAGVNNGSLVLRLKWSGPSVLFAGDIESEAEAVMAQGSCAAEILKVPHHGSRTSSTEALLEAVQPKHAIVSTGLLRGREMAAPDVLARYTRRGVQVWRTDLLGGIRLVPGRDGYSIEGARAEREFPVP